MDNQDLNQLAKSYRSPLEPHRKIPIKEEDVPQIKAIIYKLKSSSYTKQDFFSLFNDWQSSKTLRIKRVLISLSVLVIATAWIGVDYSNISFFGLKVAGANTVNLLLMFLFSITLSLICFVLVRDLDKSVRLAKFRHFQSLIEEIDNPVDLIDKIMIKNHIHTFNDLYYDFEGFNTNDSAINSYDAVKFYKRELKKSHKHLNLYANIEEFSIYALSLLATVILLLALNN